MFWWAGVLVALQPREHSGIWQERVEMMYRTRWEGAIKERENKVNKNRVKILLGGGGQRVGMGRA